MRARDVDRAELERLFRYRAEREKIREFAAAVGETNPLHFDLDAARAAGHRDLVAPPMFAVVFAGPVFRELLWEPCLRVDRAMTVHGGQEFRWGAAVIAGDELTTLARLRSDGRAGRHRVLVFQTTSENERGAMVVEGIWTVLVRPAAAPFPRVPIDLDP